MAGKYTYNDFDREFWQRELEEFVPLKLYDMHTHLWTETGQAHMQPRAPANNLRMEVDFSALQKTSSDLFPGRECHYLALATPNPGMNVAAHNEWLYKETTADPLSRCSMAVTPEMTAEQLDVLFAEFNFVGVKPYRTFAANPADARIADFLPEAQMEALNARGKAVTLHLSLKKGPAARDNLDDLKKYTKRYPHIRWILAHCARGFNACLLEESIHELKHMPNLWYDTSAVNDLYAHYLLLKHEDINRIMFGSDDVAAGADHGKYITYAYAWRFYDGLEPLEHCDSRPVPVVYEQLLQQKRSFEMLELGESEINKVFYINAREFLEKN